ncbi:TonB-dependent receptor [Haliea sp. E17]|uniref:TonB-dependent receptor n=1 Tax=Haliea sp. E17 TaxID=3401576 RepID=UPI003AAC8718
MSIKKTTQPGVADFPSCNLLASAISLALCSGALAQAEEASPSPLETMTVVGQKMESRGIGEKLTAPILDTPKSITIISSELIEQRGATSLVDALKSVPGITFNAGEGGTPAGDNLKIRGFDAGADVFIDGVRDPGSQSRDVFALEQVEVMMGPASAYSGRGSAGGSVNLATKRPQLEDSLSMRLGAGTDDYGRVAVDGNYQFSDGIAGRLNLLYHEGDVPGRDSVSYEHTGVAPSLAFGLDGDTQVHLDYYYYRTDDVPDYSIPYDGSAPASVDRDNFYGLLDRDFEKTGADIATLELRHRFGPDLSITNTTRYGKTSNDYVVTNPDDSHGNVANGYVWRGTKSRDAETETTANLTNLRGAFTLAGLEHSFATGVEFSKEELVRTGYDVSSSFGGRDGVTDPASCSYPGNAGAVSGYECTTLDNPNPNDPWVGTITPTEIPTIAETDTWSAYFFDTVTLSEQWQVNAGLRYDDYRTTQEGLSRGVYESNENDSDFWNYQLGLVYKPSPDGSIYISTGTSSRPSGNAADGTDSLSSSTANLEPEETRTYEIGTKWLLFNGRLALQSSIFQTVKDNARVATEAGRGAPQDTVGEQEVSGFDFGINGQITRNWAVTAGYTYLDSELTDDGEFGYSGNVFPNTPENSFDLWTTYALGDTVVLGAGATYVDKRYGNTANTVWVPDYTTYDMMATWQVSGSLGLQLNVQNLTDEAYFTRPFAAHYAEIGPGRSTVLTLTYSM